MIERLTSFVKRGKLIGFLAWLAIGGGIAVFLWVQWVERFRRPGWTETQLISHYWKEMAAGFLALSGSGLLKIVKENKKGGN